MQSNQNNPIQDILARNTETVQKKANALMGLMARQCQNTIQLIALKIQQKSEMEQQIRCEKTFQDIAWFEYQIQWYENAMNYLYSETPVLREVMAEIRQHDILSREFRNLSID